MEMGALCPNASKDEEKSEEHKHSTTSTLLAASG